MKRLSALLLALLLSSAVHAQTLFPSGGSGGGTPGGSDTQCQINSGGSFGGVTGCTSNGTTITLVAPVLGVPASVTLTNGTGLPTTGLTGALQAAQFPALTGDVTTSAGSLATAIGATKVTSAMLNADVFSTAHSWGGQQTFTAPILGTPASGTVTNLTGTASININGTVGATTPAAGTFTTLTATGNLTTNVTGSTQCLHVNTSGVVSGTGSDCGSGGGTSPGGSDTQVQFNDSSAFGGDAGLTYNKTSNVLTIASGGLTLSGNLSAAAWTTTGISLVQAAATYTDTSSSGTVATMYVNRLGIPTIAASSATTFTNSYGLWVEPPAAGTNVTLTNKWAAGFNGSVLASTSVFVNSAGDTNTPAFSLFGTTRGFYAANGGIIFQNSVSPTAGWGQLEGNTGFGFFTTTAAGQHYAIGATSTMDTWWTRPAAATWQLGDVDANANAVAQTLQVQSAVTGTDKNAADFTIKGSRPTGAGTAGKIIFQTAPTGSTGTTQGTLATRFVIWPTGGVQSGSATLVLTSGAIGMDKITASASAPGAGGAKLEVVCGTNAGTAKLIVYAGTSTTAVTVTDNIGTGVTGC